MKAFDELTTEERAALNEEMIRYYIDRACAEQGVQLLPPGGEPIAPTLDVIADDLEVWSVGTMKFTEKADAERLLGVLNTAASRIGWRYLSGPSYRKVADPTLKDSVHLEVERILSSERAAQMRERIEAAEREKTAYGQAREAWDTITRARQAVSKEIRDAVDAAQTELYRRGALEQLFARYLELANGDRQIAARFLVRAERDAVARLPWLADLTDERPVERPAPVPAGGDELVF